MKKARELTGSDIQRIADGYMKGFMEYGVLPKDRDGSQAHNIRLWYTAITSYLMSENVLINSDKDTNKAN